MSKSQFKQIVLIKVKDKAKQYLHDLQSKHVKRKKLNISEKMQPYLSSPRLSLLEKQQLFLLRCNSNFCKINYRSMYVEDMTCVFCKDQQSVDSVDHYSHCSDLNQRPDLRGKLIDLKHEYIYGNIEMQIKFMKAWMAILQIKKQAENG